MAEEKICPHLVGLAAVPRPETEGCEECLKIGDRWVHLRLCRECGKVGCCNDSKNRHAMKHAFSAGHPVIQSIEPGEQWLYCYPDDAFLDPA